MDYMRAAGKCAILSAPRSKYNRMYREILNTIITNVGWIIEYIGLAIVAGSVVIALIKLPMKKYTMEHVRVHFANKIIFGLEFVIAADILLATVATSIDDIMRLGGIVLIRILLGYALRKEMFLELGKTIDKKA
jgi:uncharacterized membrane protein